MKNIKEYIESGTIEMYVLGIASVEENAEVERLSLMHPEIAREIDEVSHTLINVDVTGNKKDKLSPNVKPFLMAIIDYIERLKNGEQPTEPPTLNENSKPGDYTTWLNRDDMVYNESFGNTYAKLIGSAPGLMTAIVWLKEGSPLEVHDREYEKFLILEGSCNIVTGVKVYPLVPGSYFQIPLHLSHSVEVTSEIPCKLILQRMAA